ncbi:MAG: hypothetical protein AAF236_10340, partial [Verrucomicrobiota bacterium]
MIVRHFDFKIDRLEFPFCDRSRVDIFTDRINSGEELDPVSRVFLVLIGGFMLMSTSFIFVDANSVGHLKRIYAFKELPQGRIIALEGEKGPQAQILGPGFHFIPLVRVIYDFEEWDVISIPEGYYGQLTALDGDAMPSG